MSARRTLRSPVLIGNELSVGDEDVCERSGPAQKPLCMKPWNAHMEHVIEWETVSRRIGQFSGTVIKA